MEMKLLIQRSDKVKNKYPQIINPKTGNVDCLATQLAGMYIDEREQERLELEAMRKQRSKKMDRA
jgi:hypothetical protein